MVFDIIQGVMGMGFPPQAIRAAIIKRIEETGVFYFNMETCIRGVKQIMEEEETKLTTTEVDQISDNRLCKVCMDTELGVLFLPCAHMATCTSCALILQDCPICRCKIMHTIKPIVS